MEPAQKGTILIPVPAVSDTRVLTVKLKQVYFICEDLKTITWRGLGVSVHLLVYMYTLATFDFLF